MNFTSTILLLLLLHFSMLLQLSFTSRIFDIDKHPIIEQTCQAFYYNLTTTGKAAIKTIGQRDDHLLLIITSEDYFFHLPLANLQPPPISKLYLNQIHLNRQLFWDRYTLRVTPPASFIIDEWNVTTGSLQLRGKDGWSHFSGYTCSLREENDGECRYNGGGGSDGAKINEDDRHVYDINTSCIDKWQTPYIHAHITCLCRYGTTAQHLDRLVLFNGPCSDINATAYPLPPLSNGFTGFISGEYLYLLAADTVIIIQWPKSFYLAQIVSITEVALKDFFTCDGPPVVEVLQSPDETITTPVSKAISKQQPQVFYQECQTFHSNLSTGSVTFKSIGQLDDRLLLITTDDYLINLPVDNLQPSTLYLNTTPTTTHLQMLKLTFTNWILSQIPTYNSFDSYIFLHIDTLTTDSILVGTEDSTMHFITFNCSLATGQCTEHCCYTGTGQPRMFFINSPRNYIVHGIDSTTSSITEGDYFRGRQIDRHYTRAIYLCRYEVARLDRLVLHRKPCSTIDSVPYPLPKLKEGFNGFFSRHHLYLFASNAVTIIEWPKRNFNNTKVVGVTEVPLGDFITCNEPPILQSFNGKKHYLLYSLLAFASVLLLLSLAYWLYRNYSAKQPQCSVKYLVGKDNDE